MKKLMTIIFITLLTLALAGCGNSAGTGNTSANGSGVGGLKNKKIDNYSVKIVYNEKEIKTYKMDAIKKMPTTKFELDGSTETGPSIAYILSENNIKDYSKITFVGTLKDSITMTKEQIDKGCILDITNHDTVKLGAKAINKSDWIKDIATVKVEK